MIGASRYGEPIRVLQDAVETLRTQVSASSDRMAILAAELAVEREARAALAATAARLEDAMTGLEAVAAARAERIASQAAALSLQADAIASLRSDVESLRSDAEGQTEHIAQMRGDLSRNERQAAIDLDEMRQTSNAIAATILVGHRHDATGP